MQYYFKLVRITNLCFIILVQFLMYRVVIIPIMQVYGFPIIPAGINLCLLIAATVFVSAGGYIINDYFDTKIDLINRPDSVIIGRKIDKNRVMRFYQVTTAIGIFCGLILSYRTKSSTLAFIFIVVPGLLWFYSSNYKRQFLTGNLVISFNTALSVLVVALTHMVFLSNLYGNIIYQTPVSKVIYSWVGGFAAFAFMITWIREIIKDMEDEKGDREMECRTMPIIWGIKSTKIFLYILILITIAALFIVNNIYIPFEGTLTFRYILFGIVLPLIILIYLIYKARYPADFHQASTLAKFIMLIGVLYSFIFYYLEAKTYGISIISIFGMFQVQ